MDSKRGNLKPNGIKNNFSLLWRMFHITPLQVWNYTGIAFLVYTGVYWRILVFTSVYWCLLAYTGVYWVNWCILALLACYIWYTMVGRKMLKIDGWVWLETQIFVVPWMVSLLRWNNVKKGFIKKCFCFRDILHASMNLLACAGFSVSWEGTSSSKKYFLCLCCAQTFCF